MEKEELIVYLKDKLTNSVKYMVIGIRNSKRIQNFIKQYTVDEDPALNCSQRAWILIHGSRPKCKVCGNLTKFDANKWKFMDTCSYKCRANWEVNKENAKKACIERYGVDNIYKSKEFKDAMKEKNKRLYNVEYYFQSDDYKQKMEKTCMEKHGVKHTVVSPEKRKIMSMNRSQNYDKILEKCRATWLKHYGVDHFMKDPAMFEKQLKKCYYRKEYVLPSGRKIFLQGYEPRCLDKLLEKYKEDEILMTTKEIFSALGPFDYTENDGSIHRYFPDFYIPKENKIIEVKSSRTFSVHKSKNMNKRKCCLDKGFNFEFWIYGTELNIW